MAKQAAGDAGIVDDGDFRGPGARGIEARDGTFAGAPADLRGVVEVGEVDRGVIVVVTLHAGSGAGQSGGGNRMAGACPVTGEPGRGHQDDLIAAIACFGTLGIGDAGNRISRVLGGSGAGGEDVRGGFGGIRHVQVYVVRRRPGLGQAGERVFRHHFRHRHGAFDQAREPGGVQRRGRHDRGPLADEHAQTEVMTLGPFQVLDLALARGHGQRGAVHQHRVGGIGPGGARLPDQVGYE